MPTTKRTPKPDTILRRLDGVKRQTLQWLWPGRIPLGKLTLLAGDPGLGKSLLTLDIASRVSRGAPWSDNTLGEQTAGETIPLNFADDRAETRSSRR